MRTATVSFALDSTASVDESVHKNLYFAPSCFAKLNSAIIIFTNIQIVDEMAITKLLSFEQGVMRHPARLASNNEWSGGGGGGAAHNTTPHCTHTTHLLHILMLNIKLLLRET